MLSLQQFSDRAATVAIKRISKNSSPLFDSEVRAHESVKKLNSGHFVQLLAAFTKGSEHCLMFEWADGGTLSEFWQTEVPPTNLEHMRSLVRESLDQFQGLVDGLFKLHSLENYRHGDVKPDNILRFKNGTQVGALKITDFRLSNKRHNLATSMHNKPSRADMRYMAPKASRSSPSQLSDI